MRNKNFLLTTLLFIAIIAQCVMIFWIQNTLCIANALQQEGLVIEIRFSTIYDFVFICFGISLIATFIVMAILTSDSFKTKSSNKKDSE